MKFRLYNNKLPPINSIILVCQDTTNIVGIVETIKDDNIVILMLDRIGRFAISRYDNWTQLDVNNLQSFRHTYKLYIDKNIDGILHDSYSKFKNIYHIA